MCPCEAASKTSATREKHASITHASQRRGKSVSDGFSRASLRVFAVTLLAVLRRSRLSHTQKGVVFLLFYAEIAKMKIFLSIAFWHVLGRFWGLLLALINFK